MMTAVRVVSWLFVLCALASATGIFMPSLEIQVVRTKHGSVSLYELGTHRALATMLIAAYHKSRGRALGEALTGMVLRHSKNEYVGDASDAMTTLDEVSDQDVKTLGTVFVVTIWVFLALQAVMGLLVLGSLAGDVYRKRRLLLVAGLSLVSTAVAAVLLVVCREAAWQANDELGTHNVVLGIGAYLLPVMACGALVAISCAIVLQRRARRASTPGPSRPPAAPAP